MIAISVPASRQYSVLVENGLLDRVGEQALSVTAPCTAAVVADDAVFALYGARVCASLERSGFRVCHFAFPAGESSKTLATYGEILNFLAREHLSRSDLLVALGGGVTGDMAGFAAATYLRGIACLQIPTTLLSAVDSSVGGKTAIDLSVGKNLVGSFYQPSLVLCDPQALDTLPDAVFRDGCAEVIKYGVLGSEAFFAELERAPIRTQLDRVIAVCVTMKRDLVAEDEFDRGSRRLLNLGHTFGHAVEACSGYSLSHGSCVAIGMAIMLRAAVQKRLCPQSALDRLLALLRQNGLPTESPYDAERLYRAALSDKKMTGTTMHLVVPEEIGRCRIVTVPAEEMLDWLHCGGVQ